MAVQQQSILTDRWLSMYKYRSYAHGNHLLFRKRRNAATHVDLPATVTAAEALSWAISTVDNRVCGMVCDYHRYCLG